MTEVVAIVNITPDSFSDGNAAFHPDAALARISGCIEEGASVIDIGAQSTRPHAAHLCVQQEWERLSPVLGDAIFIAKERGVRISLDTFHPEVAARAVALGVDWINDVSGFRNPAMIEAIKDFGCKLVVMHALSVPPTPGETLPSDCDVIAQMKAFFNTRMDELERAGIARTRLILDPGVGFGKNPMQSLEIMLRASELHALGVPLLLGHSRKSFLSLFTRAPARERDDLTLAFSASLAAQHIQYVRVHDTARHVALLAQMDAILPHYAR